MRNLFPIILFYKLWQINIDYYIKYLSKIMSGGDYFYIFLLFQACYCYWTTLQSGKTNLPPNIYKMDLKQKQHVGTGLLWNGNSKLGLYVFAQGKNFMDLNSNLLKYSSYQSSKEFFLFSPGITRAYYFRVQAEILNITDGDILPYTFILNTSTGNITYSGKFHKKYTKSSVIKLSGHQSFSKTSSKLLRFTLNNLNSISNVYLASPSLPSINVISNQIFCLNDQIPKDNLDLIIQHNLTLASDSTDISYNFQIFQNQSCSYKCSNHNVENLNCVQSDTTATPQPTQSAPNLVIILSAVLGSVIFIETIALIIILYKKYKKKEQQKSNKIFTQIQNLQSDKIINLSNCSICSKGNCNTRLQCQHNFHKKCLEKLNLKNKICPICAQI